MHETTVYHDGKMWEGPDALERALAGEEPDEWVAVELEPDEPPRLLTTLKPPMLLDEMVAIMQLWTRRYPTSVAKPTAAGWEIWTKRAVVVPARYRRRLRRANQRQHHRLSTH